MNRLTEKTNGGQIKARASSDEILHRLYAFENWAQGLTDQLERANNQLEKLKKEDKTKTAAFRQLLGERLMLKILTERMPGKEEVT